MIERARPTLAPVIRGLACAGVSANAVTATCLALGAVAGVLVARGEFAFAALAMGIASLGDAIDGELARTCGTASARGAIFDATVDRYEEFFFLAGLVFFFRLESIKLGLALAAMVGSFMVSYGSAKAEGCRVPVPASRMRRAGRATCLVLGTALVPFARALARHGYIPHWSRHAPILIALALVGAMANFSAVVRLRAIGRSAAGTGKREVDKTAVGNISPRTGEFPTVGIVSSEISRG